MKTVAALQALYHTLIGLLTGRKPRRQQDAQWLDSPRVESASQRQYFVSHIDDYGDCV